ncbi:MAG: YdcF family protein [Candidatus Methylomirabilia bacterium]
MRRVNDSVRRPRTRRVRLSRPGFGLLGALFLGSVALAYTPLPNWLARPLVLETALAPAQAIVVLGGGTAPDSATTNSSLRRVVYALRLYRRGLAPRVVLSGGDASGKGRLAEARAMATVAQELGFPSDIIVLETRSRRTAEHAARLAELLLPRGIRRILLVTTPLHTRRSVLVFLRRGFEVLPAPTDGGQHLARKPLDRLLLTREVLYEAAALVLYRLRGWI